VPFPPQEKELDECRWRLFIEARDSLRQVLAPALRVEHFVQRGPELREVMSRVHRSKTRQLTKFRNNRPLS
jgi:hypothetical protein